VPFHGRIRAGVLVLQHFPYRTVYIIPFAGAHRRGRIGLALAQSIPDNLENHRGSPFEALVDFTKGEEAAELFNAACAAASRAIGTR
jgi:hypothetical protein